MWLQGENFQADHTFCTARSGGGLGGPGEDYVGDPREAGAGTFVMSGLLLVWTTMGSRTATLGGNAGGPG